jgi:transcriptional regulator GlxA family with amidase domain
MVASVLLIALTNVVMLLMARNATRQREFSLCFRVSATARWMRSKAGANSASRAVPAAVAETLRVVRASNCIPKLLSSPLIEWLRADGEIPNGLPRV